MNKQSKKHTVIDANGQILGRMATEIAKILSGKNKVDFQPHIGGDEWVIVINSDKVRLSGEKGKKKIYWRHSGYPGGIYQRTFDEMMELDSRKVIAHAVEGMLPKNKLSAKAMKRLRIFKDEKHNFEKKIGKEESKK
jgi:large subunit ribosomal protein L13